MVEMKESKGKEMIESLREEVWEKAVGKKGKEVRLRDSLVGMVMPALSMEKWGGRLKE